MEHASDPELRARLRAAAALIGIPLFVSDDDAWRVDEHGVTVGLGWYRSRGHGDDEAVALALLQLWASVREERTAPRRAARRRSIARHRPEFEPLLSALARLQAAAELLAVMPGLRGSLAAAMQRGIAAARGSAETPGLRPRHLQWIALLLEEGGSVLSGRPPDAGALPGLDSAVRAEWRRLAPGAGDAEKAASTAERALARVLAPDAARAPLGRFERLLALLLPPYERLLALDAADHGLDAIGAGTGGDADGDALDDGGSGDAEDRAAPPPETGADDDDAQRRGEGRRTAEGSDLFAAAQAGFVRAMLDTPLAGATVQAILDRMPEGAAREPGRAEPADASSPGPAGSASTAGYRERASELGDAIERVRRLFDRVVVERIGTRAGLGRRPLPEGELLDGESLASAVAEAGAGVARPSAFLARTARPRRTRRFGSTDYVLLVDRSASMQGAAGAAADAALVMMEALAAVGRDVSHAEARAGTALDLDIRSALIVYDAEPEVVKPLSHGLSDVVRREMVAAIRSPRGSTSDGAALRAAGEQLGVRPGAAGASRCAARATGRNGGAS